MKFVLVHGRTPNPPSFCALCCESIGESYLRELTTRLSYCDRQCYLGHCKVAVQALQKRARASCCPPTLQSICSNHRARA